MLTPRIVALGILIAGTATAAAFAQAPCQSSLAYLASQLPYYADPQLSALRSSILSTDLNVLVPPQRADAANDARRLADDYRTRGREAVSQLVAAEDCIRSTLPNADLVIRRLQDGSGSVNNTCARAYVFAYYEVVADGEISNNLQCLASPQ